MEHWCWCREKRSGPRDTLLVRELIHLLTKISLYLHNMFPISLFILIFYSFIGISADVQGVGKLTPDISWLSRCRRSRVTVGHMWRPYGHAACWP
jgi:hypothetical protein